MPTYDYVCDGCGHKFEAFQSMKDDALKDCPACKEAKLRRLFGAGAAILFKGSGFYVTDYRSDSYTAGAKVEQSAPKPAATDTGKSGGTGSTGGGTTGTSGTSGTGSGGT
jgi:putative FmdB family regulatory protein